MSDDKFKTYVKDYYQGQSLNPTTMTRLKKIAETAAPQKEEQTSLATWRSKRVTHAIAATLFAVILATSLLLHEINTTGDLVQRIVQEVELNHIKQFESDFTASSYASLASSMDKLNFELKAPARLISAGYQIIGARYCSIQGNIATQIKLIDHNGQLLTLYATKLNSQLAEITQHSQTHINLTIELWNEGELFYSLAKTTP